MAWRSFNRQAFVQMQPSVRFARGRGRFSTARWCGDKNATTHVASVRRLRRRRELISAERQLAGRNDRPSERPPRGQSPPTALRLPRPRHAKPDFIVSGWDWVSTKGPSPLVSQSLRSLKFAGGLQGIGQKGRKNYSISSCSGSDSAGWGPLLSACSSTGPRPSDSAGTSACPSAPVMRATSRWFWRITIEVAPG